MPRGSRVDFSSLRWTLPYGPTRLTNCRVVHKRGYPEKSGQLDHRTDPYLSCIPTARLGFDRTDGRQIRRLMKWWANLRNDAELEPYTWVYPTLDTASIGLHRSDRSLRLDGCAHVFRRCLQPGSARHPVSATLRMFERR